MEALCQVQLSKAGCDLEVEVTTVDIPAISLCMGGYLEILIVFATDINVTADRK